MKGDEHCAPLQSENEHLPSIQIQVINLKMNAAKIVSINEIALLLSQLCSISN